MNEPPPAPTTSELLAQMRQAMAAREFERAERLAEIVTVREPDQEDAVGFLVGRALARQEVPRALSIGRAAVQARGDSARLHFQLGLALAAAGDNEAGLRAFRQARECDPALLAAPLWQAGQESALGRHEDALRSQLQALALAERSGALARLGSLAPALRQRLEQAIASVQQARREAIEHALTPLRSRVGPSALDRVDAALARLYGQPSSSPDDPLQQPTLLWVPGLPDQPWFEREQFPFLARLEQATEIIREELLGILGDENNLSPYVDMPDSAPAAQVWHKLNRSPDWSSYHLYRHGERIDAHCRRCPKTVALLESLALMQIPEHSPEILFSVLKPHTHIPPHTGVINGRLTVHLPLIVPENCGALCAGGQPRGWQAGQCLVFDDSFVHEAWNQSGHTRVVLIFDIWNPHLTAPERDGLATAIAALGRFNRRYETVDSTHESA